MTAAARRNSDLRGDRARPVDVALDLRMQLGQLIGVMHALVACAGLRAHARTWLRGAHACFSANLRRIESKSTRQVKVETF